MSFIQRFFNFFNCIFSRFKEDCAVNTPSLPLLEETTREDYIGQSYQEVEINENEERINVAKRTLMTKLYSLEQEIVVFENDFPGEFQVFMERIESLRETYNSSLEEIRKLLTFEIDPELDTIKSTEVLKLERDIKNFIEKEVKFSIISKRLQRLIKKLNILYNVSIFHFKECEKAKVIKQLENAIESAKKIACEFKACDYILHDKQLKERIISLISYADYQIFKASIRNSNIIPDELRKNLVMISEFENFDYINAFTAFVKDEISDLGELLPLIKDDECRTILMEKLTNLLRKLTYSQDIENELLAINFWNSFFMLESSLFEILKMSGVEKEKIKVGLIIRMNISVDENEVLVLPITNAYLALTSIYSTTQDKKILLIIKLLRNISKDVTYKEIYFLLLLFDAIEVVKTTPNELIRHIDKYLQKYPYDPKTILKRKESVINSSNKEYVLALVFNNYEKELIKTLSDLHMDFMVKENKILINSFYFNGLDNVLNSLQNNTTNMMI